MRDDQSRLKDISVAIDRILSDDDGRTVSISQRCKVASPGALLSAGARRGLSGSQAWTSAIGLRNILIHHYFETGEDLVWRVVEGDLPSLGAAQIPGIVL